MVDCMSCCCDFSCLAAPPFSFAFKGATDAGEEQMQCSSTLDRVQPGLTGASTIIMSGLLLWFGRGKGHTGIMVVIVFFPWKVPPILQFFCKGNVGCCRCWLLLLADCSASPSSSAERGVSCIYIYIYIYLCIYAFPFPVSQE